MPSTKISLKDLLLLSFFGAGTMPLAPGTVGSLATLPIIYYFVGAQSWYWVLAGLILLYGLSYWRIKACVKDKDPSWIVIDEVLGMGVGCLFFTFDHWEKLLAFFVLFRLFDIIKIFPANIIDEQDSAHGILLDDIVSGLHASIVLASLWAFL